MKILKKMSIIETNENALLARRRQKYCCQQKQYYSNQKPVLVNTLEILPRVVLYKKSLKIGNVYETLVSVTNLGLHNRRLLYTTDSEDVSINVYPKCLKDNFLDAEKSIQLTICLAPRTKLNINRRRHIFIQAEHPNITFSLPIIILCKNDNTPSLPEIVMFPSTSVSTFTFYEIILYNTNAEKLAFKLKCNCPELTIMASKLCIAKHNYIKILLKLFCNDMKEVRDVIRLKFGMDFYEIPFVHQPTEWTLFLDTLYIQFDPIKFNQTARKSFRICNESKHDIKFHVKFINETEEKNLMFDETYDALPEKAAHVNDHRKTCKKTINPSTSSSESSRKEFHQSIDKFPSIHFNFEPQCGTISPNTSFLINVTFKPIVHELFHSLTPPPFLITTSLLVESQDELKSERREIFIKAYISGTEIDIMPKLIDFRTVYFGEEHCAQIEVSNIDSLTECHVDFHDFFSHDDANALITPKEGVDLKPCQSAMFHLQFYSKVVGKFMIKLQFKIRNGDYYSIMVRGYSQHTRVKCFPDVLDLGTVPVCVPQKYLVLLMNPLTVPITVQCSSPEDGIETPLILNVVDTDEYLPIHTKDPVYHMAQCQQEEEGHKYENPQCLENETKRTADGTCNEYEESEPSLMSYHSMVPDDSSSYSTEFQEQALDYLPLMASNLLSYLKKIKIFDKPEMEKTVVEEVLNFLLKTPYFYDMDKYKNYCNMDWNALSSDPKEIYCNHEVIYLNPNTGKVISVVVIPNVIGHQHKFLELRVCPVSQPPSEHDPDVNLQQIVDSEKLVSKLWIEYNCTVPEIRWDNVIDMQEPLYVGELYEFEMIFENCSKIGGFFYYDAIPDNDCGTMRFLNGRWKYFVQPESIVRVSCAVEFRKTGFITLMGLIKFVGVNAGFPYHIKSEILPSRVNVSPQQIVKKMWVLETVNLYVYIDNATPTTTWIFLKLKDDSYISIYPEGAQLAPVGQGMYGRLRVFFKDPGTYKNNLQIIMQYGNAQIIPIILHVEGIPIFFEPDICTQGVHIGCVLCNTEHEYVDDKPVYSKAIRVTNKGERPYRIVFTKTKCSEKATCSITPPKAKINVKPNNLVLKPLSEDYITIFTNAYEELSIYNEFRVDIIDLSESTRKQSNRFVVTAQFILPLLLWKRREISMDYYRTHKYKEHPQWEFLKLTNAADNFVQLVILKLTGPFLLKEHFEDPFVKELEFSMMALETKEFFVMLDKEAVRNRVNTFYEGRITCVANSRVQKSVYLKVNIFKPALTIKQNDVVIFTKNTEGGTFIELHNTGPVQAIYKWRKLKEECRYISQEENAQEYADIILSDILHKLDLNPIQFEDDSEVNITKRFQKFRCYLRDLDDPDNIQGLIHDIINDLDLCHKRYKLEWQEAPITRRLISTEFLEDDEQLSESTQNPVLNNKDLDTGKHKAMKSLVKQQHEQISNIEDTFNSETLFFNQKFLTERSSIDDESESCVFYTLDRIVGNLKLHDSYSLSQPSSDSCEPKRSVYFYKKCGILEENQMEMCALHIPAIRKGYEVRVCFQLDVMGGNAQEFRITMVNLDNTLELSEDNVYLGLKPWYETFKVNIKAENLTKYKISLSLCLVPKPSDELPKLATGYVKILNKNTLSLPAKQTTSFKIEGIMGFREQFLREIRVTINDGDERMIRLRGQGVMPMLAMAKRNLSFLDQGIDEIMDEYRLLQKIYYFEVFKAITESEDENADTQIEENNLNKELSLITDIKLTSSALSLETRSTTDSTRSRVKHEQKMRFHQMLQTYVLVNHSDELPNSTVLDQLLETEKFLNYLRLNKDACSLLNMVHQEYLRLVKSYDSIRSNNLKHFTSQPLPFQLRANILEMGSLALNRYKKFVLNLEFFGPGKLMAAVRTVIKIPGLSLRFEAADNACDTDFIYYRSDYKPRDVCEKPYRNMNERLMDANTDPKVKHAHSYDINIKSQHQRDVYTKERKWLMSYYNSLNKSVYLEQKHHFTYCKLFSNSKYITAGTKINIIVLIRPEKGYYEHNQQIEDYLYVDRHMGPTLPILLRGTILDTARVSSSS